MNEKDKFVEKSFLMFVKYYQPTLLSTYAYTPIWCCDKNCTNCKCRNHCPATMNLSRQDVLKMEEKYPEYYL